MSTEDIFNYRKVNERVITGGQPTESQLRSAAKEGFQAVLNLATLDPETKVFDEAELVSSLGMEYHHIPVEWENPRASDFEAFGRLMDSLDVKKLLIHCVANFRVTTFYSLYAIKKLGWSESQADEFRDSVWHGDNYPIWEAFYSQIKSTHTW